MDLLQAIANRDIETITALLDLGANINITDEMGDTALGNAAIDGKKEIVELLLKRGADVNLKGRGGYTPLICACVIPHFEVVKVLLDNGAAVNVREDRGLTALDIAEDRGFGEVSQMLRQAGAGKSGTGSPCCFTCAQLSILPGGERYWCMLRGAQVERSYLCVHYELRKHTDRKL